jgi:Fic family protein
LFLLIDNVYSGHYSGQMTDSPILAVLNGSVDWLSASQLEQALKDAGQPMARRSLGRHLADLAEQGLLDKSGGGRSVTYRINPVAAWFKKPPHQRPAVPYEATRLGSYVPNQTQWLSAEQKQQLRDAQPLGTDASSYPLAVAGKLMVDLSYASSHMEGNTYNYLDTETLIQYGQAALGKDAKETAMVLNHKQAVGYLIEVAQATDPVTVRTLKEFHSLLGQDLIDVRELGALRQRAVAIGGSSYVPLAVPSQLKEAFDDLVVKATAIQDPFEQSLFWLVTVAYLQPFIDINKRVGRLACNVPLLRAGLAPLSFMSMDKQAYVKGLLEFYELGAIRTMSQAFTEAYVASAHRYAAHLNKDPEDAQTDRLYKRELADIVQSWVKTQVNQDPEIWEDIVSSTLAHVADPAIRSRLEARGRELIEGLNEGNRIVYGVTAQQYDDFDKIRTSGAATGKRMKL